MVVATAIMATDAASYQLAATPNGRKSMSGTSGQPVETATAALEDIGDNNKHQHFSTRCQSICLETQEKQGERER